MKKTEEQKAVEALVKALDNNWFNPAIFANLIVNEQPLYTQDKLLELITYIIQYQAERMETAAEMGESSNGLILAHTLNQVIAENQEYAEYM
jgi:hypothetical protein